MILAVVLLCMVAGTLAIPVSTEYYPKSQGYGRRPHSGVIGIKNHGFEAGILGFDGGKSAAAASAATSSLNSAAAAASGWQGLIGLNAGRNAAAASAAAAGRNATAASANIGSQFGIGGLTGFQFTGQSDGPFVQPSDYFPGFPVFGQNSGAAADAAAAAASGSNGFSNGGIIGGSSGIIGFQVVPGRKVSFS